MTDARTLYRESAARGISPVGAVVLAYEQMIGDVQHALDAFQQNNIELRTQHINHAILVIGYLQSHLNKDLGGVVAGNLERFYNQLREHLVQAQVRVSPEILAQQITDLLALRDAWIEVERAEAARLASPSVSGITNTAGPLPEQRARADWKI